jgi:D-cysteine desulfhydrase
MLLLLRPVASYLLLLHPYSPSYTTGRVSSNIMASTSSSSSSDASSSLSTAHSYELPVWARDSLTRPPQHGRLRLAHLPTPLYQITTLVQHTKKNDKDSNSSSFGQTLRDNSISLYIKRDDSTGGIELGGNKIRKLEFLLAEALSQHCDSVVTIGGEQSNHCRATAAACAMLGLQPHLILRSASPTSTTTRTSSSTTNSNQQKPTTETDDNNDEEQQQQQEQDMGTVGNLLFDRIVGSHIYTVTTGEYGRIGSLALVERLGRHLRRHEHQNPYEIPVGGSNGLGSFGYIEAVDELMTQWTQMMRTNDDGDDEDDNGIDHIVFACGSGGTAAGIAIGMALYHQYHHGHNSSSQQQRQRRPPPPHVHAMAVCDDPDYFYAFVAQIVDEMGLLIPNNNGDGTTVTSGSSSSLAATEDYVRASMTVHQCKGRGYAVSTADELRFIAEFARDTGVVLDPVYSGKALYGFYQLLLLQPEQFRGKRVLFWHTGGALGLYDKCHGNTTNNMDDLSYWLAQQSTRTKLNVYGNGGGGLDLSGPMITE